MAKLARSSDTDFYTPAAAAEFCKEREEPLEVMCLGLSRTGTSSLLKAFEILGYGTIYNSRESGRRNHWEYINLALDNKFKLTGPKFSLEQFESLWGEYRVVSGETPAAHAEELIDLYPDAKVVLSVRDDERKWHRSMMETMWYNHMRWATWAMVQVDAKFAFVRAIQCKWWDYMFLGDFPTHGIRKYREHNAMVKRKVDSERLLVFNNKDGWEPLCRFLGKEVPTVPFPHVFTTAEHKKMHRGMRIAALRNAMGKILAQGTLPLLVLVVAWWQCRRLLSFVKALQ